MSSLEAHVAREWGEAAWTEPVLFRLAVVDEMLARAIARGIQPAGAIRGVLNVGQYWR